MTNTYNGVYMKEYLFLPQHRGHSARESGGQRDLPLLVDQSTLYIMGCSVAVVVV